MQIRRSSQLRLHPHKTKSKKIDKSKQNDKYGVRTRDLNNQKIVPKPLGEFTEVTIYLDIRFYVFYSQTLTVSFSVKFVISFLYALYLYLFEFPLFKEPIFEVNE